MQRPATDKRASSWAVPHQFPSASYRPGMYLRSTFQLPRGMVPMTARGQRPHYLRSPDDTMMPPGYFVMTALSSAEPGNEAGWPFGELSDGEHLPAGTTAQWALPSGA